MLNSICLSSDQSLLFLIDNGDALAFPLDENNGVIIGILGDQLSASSAPDSSGLDLERLPFTLDTAKFQWQIMFIPKSNLLYITGIPKEGIQEIEESENIGSTDIDPGIDGSLPEDETGRTIGSTDIDPGRSIGSTDIDPGRTIGSTDIDPGRGIIDDSGMDINFDLNKMVVHLAKEEDQIIVKTQKR